MNDRSSLLTEDEAARRLSMSVRSLQGWRVRGGGPPFLKIGRSVRYSPSALESWVRSREQGHTAEPTRRDQSALANFHTRAGAGGAR